MSKGLKLFLKAIILILMLFIGVTAFRIIFTMVNNNEISKRNDFDASELSEGNIIEQKDPNELLFVFAGVDNGKKGIGTRTDTLMLVLANKKTKTIDIISIPRDTRVYVDGELDKINAAHSYGGMALTIKTIRDFLGIDLDYYAEVSFQAVVDGVNAMGGLDIDINEDVASAMQMNPGLHTFDGEQALNYVRFRKGYANADLGRIQTQQDFMVQFIKQMLKPKNILKIPEVFLSVSDDIDTNISTSTMISFAWAFKNISESNITTHTILGSPEMIDDISYYIPDKDSTIEMRNTLLYNYID